MRNVFGNVTMDLTIEQRLLLVDLRKVSTNTLLGESINLLAYDCHSKNEFNKIAKEVITSAEQNEKLVLDILGPSLLLTIKNYVNENAKN